MAYIAPKHVNLEKTELKGHFVLKEDEVMEIATNIWDQLDGVENLLQFTEKFVRALT